MEFDDGDAIYTVVHAIEDGHRRSTRKCQRKNHLTYVRVGASEGRAVLMGDVLCPECQGATSFAAFKATTETVVRHCGTCDAIWTKTGHGPWTKAGAAQWEAEGDG